jgi:hypothetical protein
MKAKHHFITSLAAGSTLYFFTDSVSSFWGAMIGGFLIDADHVIDQLWAIARNAPYTSKRSAEIAKHQGWGGFFARYLRRRKLLRLPLIFHSYELLVVLTVSAVYLRTPFLFGLLCGYALHLSLDLWRHLHEFRSPFFYALLFRLAHRFRREQLIKEKYL